MSPRGITRLPIRFASQIHSNLHRLLQSRKIAACPWGGGGAAAAAQHVTAWHGVAELQVGSHQDLHGDSDGEARMPALGHGGTGHSLVGAARGGWVVLGAWGCGSEPC